MTLSAFTMHLRRAIALRPSVFLMAAAMVFVVGCSDGGDGGSESSGNAGKPADSAVPDSAGVDSGVEIRTDSIAVAPGLEEGSREYVAPLADSYNRIDPRQDGWESEAFSEAATSTLKKLAKSLADPAKVREGAIEDIFADGAALSLRPDSTAEVYRDGVFAVRRGSADDAMAAVSPVEAFQVLLQPLMESKKIDASVKLWKVEPLENAVNTRVFFNASGKSADGRMQINTEWLCRWTPDAGHPELEAIEFLSYEETERLGGSGSPLLADATRAVFDNSEVYRQQLLTTTDHWRSRLPRSLGLDVVANHGLAIGDVNGDRLEDLYLCQQGGLPNRLFLQQPDGTLRDFTEESGTGWLDYCSAALIIDLDGDADRDLVISQDFQLIFMENDGSGHFSSTRMVPSYSQTFSLSAADFDEDGDLDIFACGYNPSPERERTGTLGEPMPYHDARNGGRNLLLRNDGGLNFTEITSEAGLDHNNNRFSFAAAWVDFDNDRDLDLYVANDYGRNNLYRNTGGHFEDVAAELGVEDMSAGMSTSWADLNHDGAMDLYVSNMFSAAGNRITFQRQFKPELSDPGVKSAFQRHARGNSLFFGSPDGGGFTDVTEEMGVAMGRWAWGSRFADFNNDGWEDIVVANGFITTADTTDL